MINEYTVTSAVNKAISSLLGISKQEVGRETFIKSDYRRILIQDIGISLCIPVHDDGYRKFSTAGQLIDLIIEKNTAVPTPTGL